MALVLAGLIARRSPLPFGTGDGPAPHVEPLEMEKREERVGNVPSV